ncbi:MAG: ABC transporter permease [Deltaproteobacteria bacterium]|jgi:ABC-2 type transport system permease protein|nr:ABC transporter permease [Deltaproteobacteria bacterium]
MSYFFYALRALIWKELLAIFKDRRGRIILVFPVLVQTFLFGYVATYDLEKVDYALLDEDHSVLSHQFVRSLEASNRFRRALTLANSSFIAEVLDGEKALLVIHIGPSFQKNITLGLKAPIQVLVDGRNCVVASTALSYVSSIIYEFNQRIATLSGTSLAASSASITLSPEGWYNPNLESRRDIVTSLLAILNVIQVMFLAGQAVAREKEMGTFEQLLVTPLPSWLILAGKAAPPALIGLGQNCLVLLIALYWFKIPFEGSYLILFLSLIVFNLSLTGLSLCLSTLSANMQQGLLYTFTAIMPLILLSGFATPISSMPEIFKLATLLNPVRYGVALTRAIYLSGADLVYISRYLWPLIVIGCVGMLLALVLFRRAG